MKRSVDRLTVERLLTALDSLPPQADLDTLLRRFIGMREGLRLLHSVQLPDETEPLFVPDPEWRG